jgi:uncharacterized cupredoxin-like copper-binding protein
MQSRNREKRSWLVPAGIGFILPVVAVVLLGAGGLGGKASPAGNAPADTTVITVKSFETTLAFDPDRISVKQGAVVRIRYVNESTFAHNLVIVKKDSDIDVIGPHAQEAAATGYIPTQYENLLIGFSPLAQPGKTVEFTFTAPAAGNYPFVCFVDGHYNAMVGSLKTLP